MMVLLTRTPFRRRSKIVLVGIAVLLVVGTIGVEALDGRASDTSQQTAVDDGKAVTVGEAELQNESDENESSVPPNRTIEAFEATENQTNGTVIGARLRGKEDAELGSTQFVYELDVLAANGTHFVAELYAANATVIGVESANDSDGFFENLFGSDDGVPEKARNVSELRSATDAVRLAANETEAERANQTVTEVKLDVQNETLVYRVSLVDADGEPHEVIVAADEDEGDIVTTDPKQAGKESERNSSGRGR